MSNFTYLQEKPEYELFRDACIEAEKVFSTSFAMSAMGSRKALELGVKWVYSADNTMQMPYKDNIQSLVHEHSFKMVMDYNTWGKLQFIIKLGNLAVHTSKKVSKSDALLALKGLFEFVQWIEYCYGKTYSPRKFDEKIIPTQAVPIDEKKAKELESLISQKDEEIKKLRAQIEANSMQYMANKLHEMPVRSFVPDDISEYETRKKYIDVDLKLLGWTFGDDCKEEDEFTDMVGIDGQRGFADYVLYGKDGLPLAVVEAKRTSKDPINGQRQCFLYADCLERKYKRRPMMFLTNGFETYFWDDKTAPMRPVSGIFAKKDLQKLMDRRENNNKKDLLKIKIDDNITDRYYQKEAIRACAEDFQKGERKCLLVMATGTGKTRTASSLTDVLSRGGHITNVLFLADRRSLVKQAKEDFRKYLPDMSLCNLLSNKDDASSRIVFSTYPTILNMIDKAQGEDGAKLFTPAHFDLIIIDEAHRSIFNKYKAIFEYFDSFIVGLTATPKMDVDRNTYEFFELESGVPTYAYDYETAVYKDKVLVPYYNIEVKTAFIENGIFYSDLSEDDKRRYEDDFTEDDHIPDSISETDINKIVFNQDTVDRVLVDLMTKGIKIENGDKLGKTIIFAQTKTHAQFIVERFNELYKQYKGLFISRVVCDDSYAQTIIDDFKVADKMPQIVVSVDMMDTGIDVPEVVNLVFFKKIRSKTKFWQMIGRGTRLCEDLYCKDYLDQDYIDKKRFFIFDYCGNFDYFRVSKNGVEGSETVSIVELIFRKQVRLIAALQMAEYQRYTGFRESLIDIVHGQILALNEELTTVKLKRRYFEKYKQRETFASLAELDKVDLIKHISPLVFNAETDDTARSFDNLIYGIMLAHIEKSSTFKKLRNNLKSTAELLLTKASVPQVKANVELIKSVIDDGFWDNLDILSLEEVRVVLRELIKFTVEEFSKKKVFTNLSDVVIVENEGDALEEPYTFEDYKLKVNRYIEQNSDNIAIMKLRKNIPLTKVDYEMISKIFTSELGSEDDYKREFGDTPFGLLIRKVVKLEHSAAMEVFSEFISEQGLNQQQIVFVNKVIEYVSQNGYLENIGELMKPPFDKPVVFIKLFDNDKQRKIVELVSSIKDNAQNVIG